MRERVLDRESERKREERVQLYVLIGRERENGIMYARASVNCRRVSDRLGRFEWFGELVIYERGNGKSRVQ